MHTHMKETREDCIQKWECSIESGDDQKSVETKITFVAGETSKSGFRHLT